VLFSGGEEVLTRSRYHYVVSHEVVFEHVIPVSCVIPLSFIAQGCVRFFLPGKARSSV
jgi:hypothetical protein